MKVEGKQKTGNRSENDVLDYDENCNDDVIFRHTQFFRYIEFLTLWKHGEAKNRRKRETEAKTTMMHFSVTYNS